MHHRLQISPEVSFILCLDWNLSCTVFSQGSYYLCTLNCPLMPATQCGLSPCSCPSSRVDCNHLYLVLGLWKGWGGSPLSWSSLSLKQNLWAWRPSSPQQPNYLESVAVLEQEKVSYTSSSNSRPLLCVGVDPSFGLIFSCSCGNHASVQPFSCMVHNVLCWIQQRFFFLPFPWCWLLM